MPFWIEGWVEATRLPTAEQYEHAWSGVLRISPIVDTADPVSEQLFGLSKGLVSGEHSIAAVAAARGIPPHPSSELRAELEGIKAHEARHGSGEVGGYTHATWAEVAAYRSSAEDLARSDWDTVFGIVERLADDERFANDGISFVVWYEW